MADIQAFRGLRYDLGKVGSLSEVVAPPYDVIDSDQQAAFYDLNEHNVVRLILNRGDDLLPNQTIYQRAAEHLKCWRRDGILTTENVGTIYVYHQTFTSEGQTFTRRGFMCRVRLEPFGEGSIYPHEETHSKAKEDRFNLMTACRANLSQIFSIYPDAENEAQEILEAAIDDRTPLTAIEPNGVKHEMWMVTNADAIANVSQVMGKKPMYIADGHHRYETACNIQKARAEAEKLGPDDPANYVMMMCVSMNDPGMVVLPTHRLFRGIAPISSEEFQTQTAAAFDCTIVGKGVTLAQDVWDEIAVEDRQATMGFYCRKDDTWVVARLNADGAVLMEELASNQSEEWQSLGVALLHRLVAGRLLGYSDLGSPKYVHSIKEVIDGLTKGDDSGRDATGQAGSGAPFELGCLVMPASVQDVKAISEHGERMPAKSTYFYPKMLSGLVINPLD
ncbi:MAG: DUF1015 domain-containing protein [Mariniblastus sp.]